LLAAAAAVAAVAVAADLVVEQDAAVAAPRCAAVAARGPAGDSPAVRDPAAGTRIARRRCRDRAAAAFHLRCECQAAVGNRWADFQRRALDRAVDKSRDPAAVVGLVAGRSHGLVVDRFRDPVAGKLLVARELDRAATLVAAGGQRIAIWITS
jgi:hypothetical protein